MILDIGFIVLLIIFMFLGYRRGFSLEFFNMFKYIFIIFVTNYICKFFLNSEKIKPQNQLKIFVIIVLKSIKIKRFDKFSGMIFGIMKLFFVAIIVYIAVITGAIGSKRIRGIRDKSLSVQFMTRHALKFADSFPKFIKNDVERYVVSQREKEVVDDVLNDYKNRKPDEFEKIKDIE